MFGRTRNILLAHQQLDFLWYGCVSSHHILHCAAIMNNEDIENS